jgi:hypothetical protein
MLTDASFMMTTNAYPLSSSSSSSSSGANPGSPIYCGSFFTMVMSVMTIFVCAFNCLVSLAACVFVLHFLLLLFCYFVFLQLCMGYGCVSLYWCVCVHRLSSTHWHVTNHPSTPALFLPQYSVSKHIRLYFSLFITTELFPNSKFICRSICHILFFLSFLQIFILKLFLCNELSFEYIESFISF